MKHLESTDDRGSKESVEQMTKQIVEILEEELYLGRHHPTDYHPAIMGHKEAADKIAALPATPTAMAQSNGDAGEIEQLQKHKRLQAEDIMTLGQQVGRLELQLEVAHKALEICAEDAYLDDFVLEYKPTGAALTARAALAALTPDWPMK